MHTDGGADQTLLGSAVVISTGGAALKAMSAVLSH